MNPRIRAARRSELPAVYDVLRAAFTDVPIDVFINQTERDPALRMSHVRVAVIDGRIAALVRIFARTMLVRGVPVPAAGIGSVATHPDFGGRGLATAVLRNALEFARTRGFAIAFLFTGIPGFYERIGFQIVAQPLFTVASRDAARLPSDPRYRIRRLRATDVDAALAVYRGATAGATGAIERTRRSWRAARTWLDEDAAGCFIASSAEGGPVAYVRSRVLRNFAYQVMECEHLPGHEGALSTVLAAAAGRGQSVYPDLVAAPPADGALASLLRGLPSCQESTDVRYPMMTRVLSLRGLLERLAPPVGSARAPKGATVELHGSDETCMVGLPAATGATRGFVLDEASTLDALLGQRRVSEMLRPLPSADVAWWIDRMLPPAALAFRMSDRI
jgi:predicted N-acetyltransferase YhbS